MERYTQREKEKKDGEERECVSLNSHYTAKQCSGGKLLVRAALMLFLCTVCPGEWETVGSDIGKTTTQDPTKPR